MKKKPAPRKPRAVKNDNKLIANLGELSPFGYNPGTGSPYDTTELSQANTLFKNNRWYLISNFRQLLCEIYVEHGIVQTIVDVPVDDGLRGGVEIKTKQLSPQQVEKLNTKMEREDDLGKVAQALKWNRLFGGAGVMILSDQDPESPLNIKAIGPDSNLEFRAVDMWELFWDQQNITGFDVELQESKYDYFNYYAKKVHKSRVMKMKGLTAPSFIRPRLRGWGFSVVEALVRSINQYLKSTDLTFEVLDEFKVDIYKIKNLTSTLLSNGGRQAVSKRVQDTNWQKNFQNAITMDAEDDYIQKQLSFAGLAEAQQGIRLQIASDLRMPLTKIFGISATGFNSGEDDIENYNAMVESQVRQKCKFDILNIIELRCQQMFGFVPEDLSIDFTPLRMLSAEQEENVKTQQFNRLLAARQQGEISSKEFKDACNKDDLLSIQIQSEELEADSESEAAPEAEDGGQDSGANAPDTAKLAPLAKKSKLDPKEPKS